MFADIAIDAFLDTLKTFPFLFAVYILLEYLEHKAESRTVEAVGRSRRYAPVIASLTGILPQCGFSAAASNLYAAGVITRGTLIAVFLSTSDEMLAVMLSSKAPASLIASVLLFKFICGASAGLIIDAIEKRSRKSFSEKDISELCERENCKDEEGIFRAALIHSLKISAFLLVLGIAVELASELCGLEDLRSTVFSRPLLGELAAGLVGLIPSCGASVLITRLYLEGLMSAGAMAAGLLTGSGVGVLVLFRAEKNIKDVLLTVLVLYACGVMLGFLAESLGIFAA